MKHFFFLLVALILAVAVAAIAYPLTSPYHARLRADFADPAKRQAAVRQAVDFEKNHYKALMGDKKAEYKFGIALSSGELGFKDTAQAVTWFQRAADQGYPLAELALAHCYFTGDGVPQDEADGATWARKASETGEVPQTRELMGLIFAGGVGAPQDMMRGLDLLKTGPSAEATALAADIDGKFKAAYALPKEQQDAALQKMAADVKAEVHDKFRSMEGSLAKQALVAPAEGLPK